LEQCAQVAAGVSQVRGGKLICRDRRSPLIPDEWVDQDRNQEDCSNAIKNE
jgi:hypothetical protein